MYFANPWGLLALTAVPAIIVLHLFHRRFPPLVIAGAHLWGGESVVRDAGRRRERLPVTASLLAELLAACLLAFVLADPQFGEKDEATYLVVVLDNSASMGAASPGKPSFRDLAIAELERRVAELERGSVLTIFLTGRRPVMLAGPAVSWDQAKPLVEQWQPAAPGHDFLSAWDVAAQHADEIGQLLFLTDHMPKEDVPVPKQMEIVSVGERLDNVAITAPRWIFDSATATGYLFLRLSNRGRHPVDALVHGRTEDRTIFRQSVSLPAGATKPLQAEIPGGLGRLTVEVDAPGDGLLMDSRVTLIEPKVRLLTVGVSLPADSPGFRLADRVLRSIPDVQFGSGDDVHLAIGSAQTLPPSKQKLWWLGIGPLDTSETVLQNAKDLIGPYLLEKQNPLLDGIVLGGVVWGGVQPVTLDASPLISAGRYPLLVRLNGTRTAGYVLNIDLARSNLGESPDWPVLLSNLVELRRDNLPGLRRWNYRLNEDIRFRLAEEDGGDEPAKDLRLVHPEGSINLARTPVVEVPPLGRTGVYDIREAQQSVGQFAVYFDDLDESTLTGLHPGTRRATGDLRLGKFTLDRPYSWIILLGIVLIMSAVLLDWYVLKPKRAAA